MVNYYHDMWIQWSEVLTPLMRLTSANVKFKWTNVKQMAFNKIKQIVGCETLLSYPDFNLPFKIHTDASHTQLGAVISQNNKLIAFYSRKLQLAQRQYTTTKCKLLSIIETLKEFKNILLGQQIVVYTNHKNRTYKNFNMEHVMRWQLLNKEFGPTIEYIKGPKNIIANALSRLDLLSFPSNLKDMADCYGLDKVDLPSNAFPITYWLNLSIANNILIKCSGSLTSPNLPPYTGVGCALNFQWYYFCRSGVVYKLWSQSRFAFNAFIELAKVRNEPHSCILFRNDESWCGPFAGIDSLEHSQIDESV